jgi:hypothetical protein
MNRLAARARLVGWEDRARYTDTVRTAAELASDFVALADWDDHRWIFVDSLDRADVLPEVHDVIGFLAGHLADGQLGNSTRLIVAGHRGDFAAEVTDWMREERLGPLDESHLVEFFTEVARGFGSPLSEEDCCSREPRCCRATRWSGSRCAIPRSRQWNRCSCTTPSGWWVRTGSATGR